MFDKHRNKNSEAPAPDGKAPQSAVEAPTPSGSIPSNNRRMAVIGSSIVIKGEVSGDEDLTIDGKVEGSVKLPGHALSVGSSGTVDADVEAKTVKIDGQVNGDIVGIEKVVISKSGKVRGNIMAPRVTLEDGAHFKGSIDMDPGAQTKSAPSSSTGASASKPARVAESAPAQLSMNNG
ncbi:MAG: bactofilin family protein [bacterium]